MNFTHLCILALSLTAAACNNGTDTDVSDAIEAEAAQATDAVEGAIQDAFSTEPVSGANYGAGVAADAQVVALAAFAEKLSANDSLSAVVEGEVVEVCQKKGCLMTIQSPVAEDLDVTVRFKDYGFFMPKSLSGSTVLVEGQAKTVVTPVEDLRHYAEDAGKSAEEIAAITEPKEEIEFIATGVRVL